MLNMEERTNSFVCQYGFVMLKVLLQYAKPYQFYKSEKMHVTVHFKFDYLS